MQGIEKQPTLYFRKSNQPLLPHLSRESSDGYQVYPIHHIGNDAIFTGFESLSQYISNYKSVIIDGFQGIVWEAQIAYLSREFDKKGISVNWIKADDYMLADDEISRLIAPFLGEPGSVWGTKCTLVLKDFFRMDDLLKVQTNPEADLNVVIGTGAFLVNWDCPLLYIDLPKNEAQYRMRSGLINNLGMKHPVSAAGGYKQQYFVDWVLLNQHKAEWLPKINIVADGQWNDSISWITNDTLVAAFDKLSRSVFRVRPWFEPGAWGGQWMKQHINGINKDEINYAWSFELITPENGIIFESEGNLLEVSFDWLMLINGNKILGAHASRFGTEFPIRFDFLDTLDGGNLSIQCHPSLQYIQDNFGENMTQDETYYILDCKEDAVVYLGFQDDINPDHFRNALVTSQRETTAINIERYVKSHRAHKHDLFLIPNSTIHSAGKNNLVLEISATPYIFTFKMYDWLRLDLDGNPRPINIGHAFKNLNFERKGERVKKELISTPQKIEQGDDWAIIHLPTHPEHFYDVHRADFNSAVTLKTNDSCLVLMLVEGESISINCNNGVKAVYHYAETFVVPAAAIEITVFNLGPSPAKLIFAFIKPGNDDKS